jgi:hypothetical protein
MNPFGDTGRQEKKVPMTAKVKRASHFLKLPSCEPYGIRMKEVLLKPVKKSIQKLKGLFEDKGSNQNKKISPKRVYR